VVTQATLTQCWKLQPIAGPLAILSARLKGILELADSTLERVDKFFVNWRSEFFFKNSLCDLNPFAAKRFGQFNRAFD